MNVEMSERRGRRAAYAWTAVGMLALGLAAACSDASGPRIVPPLSDTTIEPPPPPVVGFWILPGDGGGLLA